MSEIATWPEWAEKISEPGVYDMPDELYHLDPVEGGSLSSSGARKLLPPHCPAIYKHERDNPPAPKKHFDIGHAAHKLVLGSGPELVRIDAERWDTNKVKAEVAAVRADGAIPLKPGEYQQVHDMADAIRKHRIAGALFDPEHGQPEQSLIWQDGPTKVWRRARFDWLPDVTEGRLIIPDYKTSHSADPGAIARTVYQYGYYQQAAWYLDGAEALGLGEDLAFLFVVQSKDAPYLITVVELRRTALRVGRERNRQALEVYAECVATCHWPAHSDEIELISLPAWVENDYLQEAS
ncbi:PD-(D/E)XK nuclease-like domain-containing protein [Nonomuraea sp. NPDC023979]|uniref:PD-(D/E)XK nuclease-like domain-containing protein n=1 Tax=Nonomuraea sp. NPDC023979 TaxID=3154796 RepID=UPI0033F2ACA0